MYTVRQMVRATPSPIQGRAKNQCFGRAYAAPRRKLAQKTKTKSGGYLVEDKSGTYREFRFRVKCTEGWRKVALRFYGPLKPDTKAWCWCSCPYFKYHCEVALSVHGSSAVVQSNGQRPRFTNPSLEPRVCKHALLGFRLAMRRWQFSDKSLNAAMKSSRATKARRAVTKASMRKVWGAY